jgi:hypothetical protein
LAAILKILKTKSTTLSDDLFLCQVSNGSAVPFPFNIFCTLVTMTTAAILNFFNPPPKLPHTTVDIPTKFHEVWWKESKIFLNPPFFVYLATAAKFVQPIFFGLSRSTRCCSYQVSSISVRRVTRYDIFCVYSIF